MEVDVRSLHAALVGGDMTLEQRLEEIDATCWASSDSDGVVDCVQPETVQNCTY